MLQKMTVSAWSAQTSTKLDEDGLIWVLDAPMDHVQVAHPRWQESA